MFEISNLDLLEVLHIKDNIELLSIGFLFYKDKDIVVEIGSSNTPTFTFKRKISDIVK